MDEMSKKAQADLIELEKQIDLLLLTFEATRKALIKEEVKPGENPFANYDDDASREIGRAMVEADMIRRRGVKEGAIAAFDYAIRLVEGIVKKKTK